MWHLSSFVRLLAQQKGWPLLVGGVSVALAAAPLPSAAQSGSTQPEQPAPTVRYARGEDVGLDEIVAEWRGYYADVPVYQCVCQADICDQSEGWPYREYDRFQLSVALGPNNGKAAEVAGFNCFDIADGSRPSQPRSFSAEERNPDDPVAAAPPRIPAPPVPSEPPVAPPAPTTAPASTAPAPAPSTPAPAPTVAAPPAPSEPPVAPPAPAPSTPAPAPTAPPPNVVTQTSPPAGPPAAAPAASAVAIAPTQAASSAIPRASVINDGAAIQLDWPSGTSDVISVANSNWNLNVLSALDCESISLVSEKVLAAQRVVGEPAVDSITGNVAVPVLLDSCVETDQSAVFVLDPNEGGGYALYRSQLPGEQALPNEFSTYAFSSITGVQYWDGYLLVRQANAAGAEALSVFLPGDTPSGAYGGCGILRDSEGAALLCGD